MCDGVPLCRNQDLVESDHLLRVNINNEQRKGWFFIQQFRKQHQNARTRLCRRIKREHELHTRQVPRQFVPAHCSHEQPFYHRADVPPRANKAAKWLVHLIHSIFRHSLQFTCYRYFYPRYKIVLQSAISGCTILRIDCGITWLRLTLSFLIERL